MSSKILHDNFGGEYAYSSITDYIVLSFVQLKF
jgi:hypothetical protein